MKNYIDIHTHILWELDDGSSSFEESTEMLRMAEAEGTRHIIATPHYNSRRLISRDSIESRVIKLNAWAEQNNLSVRVYAGNEIWADPDTLSSLLSDAAFSLADSRYVLMEFPNSISQTAVLQMTASLLNKGLFPIVAHAERSFYGRDAFSFLELLYQGGVLISINADSLFYRNGVSRAMWARKLLCAGLVFAVASDCHHVKTRPPKLHKAARLVSRIMGKETANALFYENPLRVLQNADKI